MDARRLGNPQLLHAVNGGRSSKPGDDEALRFLSQEEQECLKFFEKTIDSLDESLDPGGGRAPTSNPIASSHLARHPGHKDQDIIYLVRPEPDLLQTKEPIFNPSSPDFNSMMQNPGSHFEMKPRREAIDSLPSEYHPPLPKGSYGSTDNHSSYHPPGSIPTPVLIAQQIADHRGGGTANLPSSSFLRSYSQESDGPLSPAGDSPGKHGHLNSTKAPRFPANISVILGSKDHQNQSLGNVNIQERRAQMLANLTGAPNPLLQEDPQPTVEAPTVEMPTAVPPPLEPPTAVPRTSQNTPTRSISFKDPSPDKSRMEALSKLGLSRNRAMSEGLSLLGVPSLNPQPGAETSAKPIETSAPPTPDTTVKMPEANVTAPRPSPSPIESKPEILRSDSLKRYDERHPRPSPSYYPPPPPLEDMASFPPPPEVTLASNSYRGKSITVNPAVSTRRGSTTPPGNEAKVLPTALSNPSEFNSYGGKTKVINTAPVAMARSDLPDILSSHMKSQTLPPDLSYGVKSRTFNPAGGSSRHSDAPAKSFKAPAPTPAPRPPRHSYHGGAAAPKPAARAPSPEHRRRSTSMFRPQGITVQFSGRGPTDESRREALRKLGLLKES